MEDALAHGAAKGGGLMASVPDMHFGAERPRDPRGSPAGRDP